MSEAFRRVGSPALAARALDAADGNVQLANFVSCGSTTNIAFSKILVSNHCAGVIIGRTGFNIRALRTILGLKVVRDAFLPVAAAGL